VNIGCGGSGNKVIKNAMCEKGCRSIDGIARVQKAVFHVLLQENLEEFVKKNESDTCVLVREARNHN